MSNLKNVKTLTLSGMFIALSVVCGFLNLPITQFIEIRFGSLMLAVSGMLLGPAISAVIGALSDIIAFMVKPTGPFFPGFTISAAVSGELKAIAFVNCPSGMNCGYKPRELQASLALWND